MKPVDSPKVMLVGAGPGSADLLTVRALRAIEHAEALLYDALIDDEILQLAPRPCLRILTGKRSGGACMQQAEINALMLKLARRGLKVVRLKGGDPSVFGRSGEEKDYLEARGVAVEIVPGITAASAAAAQFGFPLTHRGQARRVTFATARTLDGAIVEGGWDAGADPETTLVLYMARDAAQAVAERLMEGGRSPFTPALVIENAGRPGAHLLKTELGLLGLTVGQAKLVGPVLLVIGEVAIKASQRGSLIAGEGCAHIEARGAVDRAKRRWVNGPGLVDGQRAGSEPSHGSQHTLCRLVCSAPWTFLPSPGGRDDRNLRSTVRASPGECAGLAEESWRRSRPSPHRLG